MIKTFRVWDKKYEKMIDWGAFINSRYYPVIEILKGENPQYVTMMNTDLQDKKGTDIYEDDLVLLKCNRKKYIIEFDEGIFILTPINFKQRSKYDFEPLGYYTGSDVSVIGNIHKNRVQNGGD